MIGMKVEGLVIERPDLVTVGAFGVEGFEETSESDFWCAIVLDESV